MEYAMTVQDLGTALRGAGLDKVSVDLSNIGKIGIAPDFSQNLAASPIQDAFPFAEWLLSTPASQKMRTLRDQGKLKFNTDSQTGLTNIVLPFTYSTTTPPDTIGECCFQVPDLAMCSNQAPFSLLCIKDCDTMLNEILDKMQKFGSTDLITPYTRQGQSVYNEKREWVREWMRLYTAHTLVNGTMETETLLTKPFHGMLDIMNNDTVVVIPGANILAAFDAFACRLQFLGITNGVFWMNPLVYQSVQRAVMPDRNGNLPAGWEKNTAGALTFEGMSFRTDPMLPVDLDAGTGEIWFVDGGATGAMTATTLRPQEDFIYDTTEHGQTRVEGCATNCLYMYNAGTVFNTNPWNLAIIQGVPLSANCMGGILTGFDGRVQPNTLIPGMHATAE